MTRQRVFLRRSANAMAVGLGLLGGLAAMDARAGLAIDRTPLDPELGSRTANEHRTFIVVGCVPQNLPKRGLVGSVWVACNDLDFVKDKVVESDFVSCLDVYPNGVLQGLFIKEINNRTWQSFRFSCRDLQPDGSVGASFEKAPFLFDYEREGTLHETTVPTSNVTMGIFEVWNRLQLRGECYTLPPQPQRVGCHGNRNPREGICHGSCHGQSTELLWDKGFTPAIRFQREAGLGDLCAQRGDEIVSGRNISRRGSEKGFRGPDFPQANGNAKHQGRGGNRDRGRARSRDSII